MYIFGVIAVLMAVLHLAAARRRPRMALFVAAILWLLYAYYEYLVDSGVLCDANCDIRVDLLLFIPILYIASHYAYSSYMRPPEQHTVLGMVLGAMGLMVLALLLTAFGYIAPACVAVLSALALGAYAVKSRVEHKAK
jgi:peptidoglycan/LPS O-acetylase OafA/YrhL